MVPDRHINTLFSLFRRYAAGLERKSHAITRNIRPVLEKILPFWICAWLLLASLRMASSPRGIGNFTEFASLFLPYALIALAPLLALRLSESAFADSAEKWTPQFRLARLGRWQALDRDAARSHPLFGPAGFMASLLIGLLLNVVVRSGEFLLAVPAITSSSPDWARTIFLAMAFEVVAMNFLYIVCFVMALRTIPLFPRMLAVTWGLDILMQLSTASVVQAQGPLPPDVAAALAELLTGNITKVMISIFVWLPYLLLSDRVNVTYRCRAAC